MLMVIFGAGASYDSYADLSTKVLDEARPPLADELFSSRERFRIALQDFSECQPLITRLSGSGVSVEKELDRAQDEAENYPVRYQQLAAIRFYLRRVLFDVENAWKAKHRGVTNYKTLVDDLEQSRLQNGDEELCTVTFNYDTMLESALPTVGIFCQNFEDYIRHKWKIIKLHGSVNWAHPVDFGADSYENSQYMRYMIGNVQNLKIHNERFEMIQTPAVMYQEDMYRRIALFPALAIPVIKKVSFECPPDHLEVLRSLIPKITQILTIGWRGTEKHFLKLLTENGPGTMQVPVTIIDKNHEAGAQVKNNLAEAGIGSAFNITEKGFSESLRDRSILHYISAYKEYAALAKGTERLRK